MRQQRFAIAVASLSVFGLLSTSSSADAKDKNKPSKDLQCAAFYGPFSSNTGEPCASPIGLCTHGLLDGEFEATYDATFLTLESANDASDPSKFVYTGTSVVAALDGSGVIYTEDTGVIHIPQDNSPAQFVTKAIVTEGTKDYKKTSGGFVAQGALSFSTGSAEGSFSAVLCDPEKDHGHPGHGHPGNGHHGHH
ncbi:MAG: hypothetical protein RLZZ450_3421 [Pseudomonadota bacterium]|jgi:hypothetical protein